MADTLDLIEDRIADLERKVFGHPHPTTSDLPQIPVAESLIQIGRNLTTALTGHEKCLSVMKRLSELNNFIEMSCEDSSTTDKLHMILIKEAQLRSNLTQLEQARRLAVSVLDNPQALDNLKAVNNLSGRLEKLSVLTLNSRENHNEVTDQVQELFSQYNTIVNDLTRSFILFDELVSAKEAAASASKSLD